MKKLLLLLAILIVRTTSNTCRMELLYTYNYGHGYVITCDHTNFEEFANIVTNNGLVLTIGHSNVPLKKTLFQNLPKLRELNIHHSFLYNNNGTPSLSGLVKLEALNLPSNKLINLPEKLLVGLTRLRVLNLQNNSIIGFAEETFKNLYYLKTLNLSRNNIANIPGLNLCELYSIDKLDLSYNQLTNLEPNYFQCLTNLDYLNLAHNKLQNFNKTYFPLLTQLDVSYNLFTKLDFCNATHLKTLNLNGNKLTRIEANDFNELHNLEKLNLKNNSIEYFDPTDQHVKLKEINLEFNKLKWIDLRSRTIEKLNLSHNLLTYVVAENITHLTKLKEIDLSFNKISSIAPNTFRQIHSIKVINLQNNNLKELHIIFDTQCLVTILNLSHNNFTTLNETIFKNLKKLQSLDLSNNHLTHLNDSVFSSLINLETLNISYNKLSNIDYEVVDPLENLRILDIEGNQLKNIDYSLIINELPNLDVINVKNNLLSCEFLGKMIHYFKQNEINFTINEHFEYEKENVAGIYCKETQNRLLNLQETKETVLNNSILLSQIYSISRKHESSGIGVVGIILFVLLLMCCSLLVSFIAYKYYLWTKRKHYIDELELIDNETCKSYR